MDRIKEIAAKTKETYAVTNNHLNGQAPVNALEIAARTCRASELTSLNLSRSTTRG